jgi:hypothetical protein
MCIPLLLTFFFFVPYVVYCVPPLLMLLFCAIMYTLHCCLPSCFICSMPSSTYKNLPFWCCYFEPCQLPYGDMLLTWLLLYLVAVSCSVANCPTKLGLGCAPSCCFFIQLVVLPCCYFIL